MKTILRRLVINMLPISWAD